jgi:hypothetical protein
MAQSFLESAHNRIDPKKYGEGYDHIFMCRDCGLKKTTCECDQTVADTDEKEKED